MTDGLGRPCRGVSSMCNFGSKFLWGASLLVLSGSTPAWAGTADPDPQTAAAPASDAASGDIVVTADRVGLLETRPTDSVFGLSKSLVETPRAASVASALTLARYGIKSVTDLIAVSPGAGTASWYGVPGSVNLRGTIADNYFRNFQRLPNYGTYATPLGGASEVQIVRGPPSAIYGAGKVGGFVNYIPFEASAAKTDKLTGELTGTFGSYAKKNVTGKLSAPVAIGGITGGLSGYVEADDSHSYYRGVHPRYQLYQIAADFDLGNGFFFNAGGMIYHSKGYIQTFQNRLTQDLVDHGTYITGRDTSLVDTDGNGRLTPNEAGMKSFHNQYNGVSPGPVTARSTLDAEVGTTHLSTRDISISDRDFSNTTTQTYYADIGKTFDDASVKLSYFRDALKSDRFFSYGFPASYKSHVQEFRFTYDQKLVLADWLKLNTVAGASYRWFAGRKYESYLGGFVSVDRRDISYGATPTDIFDDPFSSEPGNIGQTFETQVHAKSTDAGAFAVADVTLFDRLGILLSGRYDDFGVTSRDAGTIVYTVVKGQDYTASQGKGSYSASINYKTGFGLVPYVTHADTSALETNQAGDIQPGQIYNRDWLSKSRLDEAGVKFDLLSGHLVGSVAIYKQRRTRNDPLSNTQVATHSKGLEGEVRYVLNRNISITASGNLQRTLVLGDTTTTYIPPTAAGVSGVNGYGVNYRAAYSVFYPDLRYTYTLIPKTIDSLFVSYTSNPMSWGTFGGTLGAVYTGNTSTLLPAPYKVYFHDHTVANLSVFVQHGPYTITGNVTNLFDKRYYQPATDTTANVVTIPGLGREWKVTLGFKF
ncbi:TonB-dependent siderophore receptor [Sphingomonas nostoxanthinifaciens]|uniref:TonB-dependent siderophore receptor n=1 Tax=Sphingomonas nostoxanthinifaciens TaxID=2872652 RepID=UPI001CC2102E|nr:TonB-dependent receptor [Sphingomonas nostoxanthinifaciens]UAK25642.1 TonB-dependent receptor [Sphingomonas nostoxanthinifaciens]